MGKQMFKSAYNHEGEYVTPNGETTVDTYEHRINKYGEKYLEKTGEKNIYEVIQTYLEESKIENAINRVIAGDVSGLRPDGNYIDCTQMPRNMIEAQTMIQDMNNMWLKLPINVRAEYNHSVEQFIADSGSEKWLKAMGLDEIEPMKTVDTKAPLTDVEKGLPAGETGGEA